jgi:hypothetical protein
MRQRLPPGHLPPKHQAALLRGKVGAARARRSLKFCEMQIHSLK